MKDELWITAIAHWIENISGYLHGQIKPLQLFGKCTRCVYLPYGKNKTNSGILIRAGNKAGRVVGMHGG